MQSRALGLEAGRGPLSEQSEKTCASGSLDRSREDWCSGVGWQGSVTEERAGWPGIAEMLLGGVRSRSMGKAAARRDGAAPQRDEAGRPRRAGGSDGNEAAIGGRVCLLTWRAA